MPNKKSALSKHKSAPKAAAKVPAKKAPLARREPPVTAAKPLKAAKAAPPKPAPAPKAKTAAKTPAPKPAPSTKAAAPKPAPGKKADVKAAPKPQKLKPETRGKPAATPKATKPAAKPAPEPKKATPKGNAPAAGATKPAAKPAPPVREKPPKPPKAPKPPKLAPVAAALAKPIPAKPLAVAAGRAQPVVRSTPLQPIRTAPKPLPAPKAVAAEPELVGEPQAVPAFKAKSGAKGMVLVGAVAGAFGVKGEVRLRAFTDRTDGVISYGPLYGADGKVLLRPKSWRGLKDGVAVVAPEVKTREQAEKLRGQKVFVPRANLPATAEDEFYIVDLLGCRAESLDGQVLGDIVAVWNFGAGDILEYRPQGGGPNVRVTFTKETAPLVDLTGRRVVLDPPAPEVAEK